MITRRKDYCKRAPSRDASKIYIVCEGEETEKNYFSFFEGLSSNLQLIVIPPEEGTDPLKLIGLAKHKFLNDSAIYSLDYKQRDRIWFAIDTDSWEKEGKIQPLREFCAEMNRSITQEYDEVKAYDAWRVAQSNPCFEIWLYYHFFDEAPSIEESRQHPSFKAFVHSCIPGGFDYQRDPAWLKSAIDNSLKNFKIQPNGNPQLFSTEQHLIGNDIYEFVGYEVQKLRNKLG